MCKPFILAIYIASITACSSTGTIQGVSGNNRVQFEYEQTLFDHGGKLKVAMPDGEQFSGQFVQSSSSYSGTDWEIGESSDDDSIILKDSTTLTSEAKALLIGNRGSTMTCWLTLSAPEIGLDGGGIGKCETSKKDSVSFTF